MFGMLVDRIRLDLFGDTTSLVCGHSIRSLGRNSFNPHGMVKPPLGAGRSQEFGAQANNMVQQAPTLSSS